MASIVKVAQVGFTQVGQHTFRWVDAIAEAGHFSRMADARFDHGQVVVVVQRPNAQRHPQLAVVAQRTSVHSEVVWQQGCDPFFDGCFPVASSNGQDWAREGVALGAGMGLQGEEHVGDHEHIAVFRPRISLTRRAPHNPMANPCVVGVLKKVVSVVPRTHQGKEDGFGRTAQGSRVGAQMPDKPVVGPAKCNVASVGCRVRLAPGAPSLNRPPAAGHSTAVWLAAT